MESELKFGLKSGLSWVCVNVGVGVRVVVWVDARVGVRAGVGVWVMVGVGLRL